MKRQGIFPKLPRLLLASSGSSQPSILTHPAGGWRAARSKGWRLLAALCLFIALTTQALAEPLILGIVPYLSSRKLAELYEPLRARLEAGLKQPVVIETAKDYQAHVERLREGRYDIVAASPALAPLMVKQLGYVALARTRADLEPLIVVRKGADIRRLEELRGKILTTSDRLAALTLAARRHLRARGLQPGRDIEIRPMGSHANSLAALENGESAAAVVSVTALRQIGGDWTGRVEILERLAPMPPLLYLAHARLGPQQIDEVRALLFQFANQEAAGKEFATRLGHHGLIEFTAADLQALEPIGADLMTLINP